MKLIPPCPSSFSSFPLRPNRGPHACRQKTGPEDRGRGQSKRRFFPACLRLLQGRVPRPRENELQMRIRETTCSLFGAGMVDWAASTSSRSWMDCSSWQRRTITLTAKSQERSPAQSHVCRVSGFSNSGFQGSHVQGSRRFASLRSAGSGVLGNEPKLKNQVTNSRD